MFNAAAAKAAGYSDQEIQEYLGQKSQGMSLKGFGQNLATNAQDVAKSIPSMLGQSVASMNPVPMMGVNMAQGKNPFSTGNPVGGIVNEAMQYRHPIKQAYTHPVNTGLDALALFGLGKGAIENIPEDIKTPTTKDIMGKRISDEQLTQPFNWDKVKSDVQARLPIKSFPVQNAAQSILNDIETASMPQQTTTEPYQGKATGGKTIGVEKMKPASMRNADALDWRTELGKRSYNPKTGTPLTTHEATATQLVRNVIADELHRSVPGLDMYDQLMHKYLTKGDTPTRVGQAVKGVAKKTPYVAGAVGISEVIHKLFGM